jgi:hypothetical protein
MKTKKTDRFASLLAAVVMIALVGLCLVGGTPGTGTLFALSQLTSTPAAPGNGESQAKPEERAVDEMAALDDGAYTQRAQAPHQADVRVPAVGMDGVVTSVSEEGVVCQDILLNPQMDVVEFGDGTWSVDPWIVWWPEVYTDDVEYNSASYSLAMKDDPSVDTEAIISSTLDFDGFLQMFMAPSGLMTVTISYSRLYNGDVNSEDYAAYSLYTVTNESLLGGRVAIWEIGTSPSPTDWSNRSGTLTPSADATELAKLSGKWVALRFELWSDRVSPYEFVWVDDVQVNVCYRAEQVYLPLVQRGEGAPAGCTPLEPDSVTQRGFTLVGATCNGCFSPLDTRDYYSLDLNGASEVRVCLRNLPSGTNWDALIYEDSAGYPLICQIGTPGDQDKCSNYCTLNPAKSYFVMVNAGAAPPSTQCYEMSVESSGTVPTTGPSGPTPGFWESTTGDEFYVTTDRAYVDDFAIYISVSGCGNYKITHNPQEPISSNHFSFTGSFYANGTFSDPTHCSGQDGLNSFYIPGCGYITGGPWSWNATWKNSSQPTFLPAEVIEPETVEPMTGIDDFHIVTLVQ